MDAIVNHAAFMPYWSNGQVQIPMVIRTMGGSHTLGAQHSKSLEAWLTHVPGLKVVMPSTPYDAKGLLKAAIRDPNPVIFIEHKLNYRRSGPLPESDYVVPLGEADVKRKGSDITIVATCTSVHESLKAAQTLQGRGIECEIVDPRTLIPLDMSTILGSVAKTGRLLIVHEAWKTGGFGAEIVARVCESSVHLFKSPPVRLCGADTPNPYSPSLEPLAVPRQEQIEKCVLNIFEINSSL
jgi:pyruvate dehydrogenase E1 component beta subunit